ncbi:MAG: aminodeoxychorismate lyase [Gammaproteobacteria bacterium]|nr:aminodeoxychorismate lyase [Gammaproteobacteria bacterium]
MLINGVPENRIGIQDRGLLYGDGVFRTLCVEQGRPLHWAHHYRKLHQDCAALDLPCPEAALLAAELGQLSVRQPDGIAKIIITRGTGERGYAPPASPAPVRILSISPSPVFPEAYRKQGVRLRLCDLHLSHQPRLAGIKHLNRLENVLAAAEWRDPDIAEGLLLDMDGNVIEGTRSNLFLVRNGILFTPDLSRCGVAGVQRERVMRYASSHSMACTTGCFTLDDVLAADEVFLVNSVIGLWPVCQLQGRNWSHYPVSHQIAEWLSHESTD